MSKLCVVGVCGFGDSSTQRQTTGEGARASFHHSQDPIFPTVLLEKVWSGEHCGLETWRRPGLRRPVLWPGGGAGLQSSAESSVGRTMVTWDRFDEMGSYRIMHQEQLQELCEQLAVKASALHAGSSISLTDNFVKHHWASALGDLCSLYDGRVCLLNKGKSLRRKVIRFVSDSEADQTRELSPKPKRRRTARTKKANLEPDGQAGPKPDNIAEEAEAEEPQQEKAEAEEPKEEEAEAEEPQDEDVEADGEEPHETEAGAEDPRNEEAEAEDQEHDPTENAESPEAREEAE